MSERHTLILRKHKYNFALLLEGNDQIHAQAQAVDIAKALKASSYEMVYNSKQKSAHQKRLEENDLYKLFKKLSTNDFTSEECYLWSGSTDKKNYPCVYLFNERKLVKEIVNGYLNTPKKYSQLKMLCGNNLCINPHHFSYTDKGNRQLTAADVKLLLLYASRGVEAAQLAKLFKVSRSTIYRNLNRERIRPGTAGDRNSIRRR